jgi:elongation factor Ts
MLHIAAMNPLYVSSKEIPADTIEKEKLILRAKALEEGKKPEFVDKIVDGQINKWCSEVCLLDQKFVKNPDVSISQLLTELIASIGENIVIRRFTRYELGEGIQKETKDFAAEVAQQLKG